MKVAFFTDHRFVPSSGAIHTVAQFEATLWPRYLRHFGTLHVVGRLGQAPDGVKAAALPLSSSKHVDFTLLPNLSSVRAMPGLRGQVRRRIGAIIAGADGVIARLPSEIGLMAVAEARRQAKPFAVEVVGCPWDGLWHYGGLAAKLYAPVRFLRMRRAVGQAPYALYVTRTFLQGRYPPHPTACTTVASNVEVAAGVPGVLQRRLTRIARQARPLRLGLIGTLTGRFKGIQTALNALALCHRDLPPVLLHVLGPGDAAPWRQMAGTLGIGHLVQFDGTLPAGPPVLDWLDQTDIYLQPSLKEGLPRALIEAMSRGCPALATSVAGIPELLPADDLCPAGDAAGLAARLVALIHDREGQSARARRNFERAGHYDHAALSARRDAFWAQFAAQMDRAA